MCEPGELTVLHGPFMFQHYLASKDRPFADFTPEPGHEAQHWLYTALPAKGHALTPAEMHDFTGTQAHQK